MGYVINQDGSTGHDWCRNKIRKDRVASRTSGRNSKGKSCQAEPLERFMAKRGRSYKHRRYANWSAAHQGKT